METDPSDPLVSPLQLLPFDGASPFLWPLPPKVTATASCEVCGVTCQPQPGQTLPEKCPGCCSALPWTREGCCRACLWLGKVLMISIAGNPVIAICEACLGRADQGTLEHLCDYCGDRRNAAPQVQVELSCCDVCGCRKDLLILKLPESAPRQVCVNCSGGLLRQFRSSPALQLEPQAPPTFPAILQELGRVLAAWGVEDWIALHLERRWGQRELEMVCRVQLEYERAIAILATTEPPDFTHCNPPSGAQKSPHWEWRWTGRVLGADLELVAVQRGPALGVSALSRASSSGLSQPPPDGAARDSAEDVEDTISVDEQGARP